MTLFLFFIIFYNLSTTVERYHKHDYSYVIMSGTCEAILKTGDNSGKPCGNVSKGVIKGISVCGRHGAVSPPKDRHTTRKEKHTTQKEETSTEKESSPKMDKKLVKEFNELYTKMVNLPDNGSWEYLDKIRVVCSDVSNEDFPSDEDMKAVLGERLSTAISVVGEMSRNFHPDTHSIWEGTHDAHSDATLITSKLLEDMNEYMKK